MFQPIFTLSPRIIANLTQIERLYGQLEGLRIPKKLELNLQRDHLIKSTYISNSIEGNPLSFPEVTNLLLGDRIPANRDEREVKNYFDLLKSLDQHVNQPLTLSMVTDLHTKLLKSVDNDIAGQIRNTRVVVGGYETKNGISKLRVKHEPPFHNKLEIERVSTELLNWVEQDTDTSPLLKIGIFHHQYVYIHPFVDGNGRTCRLLTALIFLKYGYQINKYFVLDDYYDLDRFEYSDKLSTADEGDKSEWLTYFTDGVKYSLQSALSRIETTMLSEKVIDRPTPKEQEILIYLQSHAEVTSQDLVNEFKVSRQQAHKLLAGLVDKGYVKKKGGTKNSYYSLK
ncbi:MAG: Fic family protein [Microgenomates group bacterium Gr01-1014_16]|nr:MAG: Fic family protein [Microgenomates group bacterium Gr01-1014_16]